MNKQEAMAVLAKYLPPPILSEFMQFWWASGLEQATNPSRPSFNDESQDELTAEELAMPAGEFLRSHEKRTDTDAEPWLEDCPHCKGAHMLGTIALCPKNPHRPEWVRHLEASE